MALNTKRWETLYLFEIPKSASEIELVDSPFEMPESVDQLIRDDWDRQLISKKEQLNRMDYLTEIRPYHLDVNSNPLNALYENEKVIMWPGPVISLKEVVETEKGIDLLVGQTSYPFIAGLNEERIKKLYQEHKVTLPRPALSICTFVLTQDNQLIFTVRGEKTNMYPGKLHGVCGNPLYTNDNLSQHQLDEIEDEILIHPNEYDHTLLKFTGVVIDNDELPKKPDLSGWIPIPLEAEDIKERVSRIDPKNRPNDAADITFAPGTEGELFDYLTKMPSSSFCPHAQGGLILYGYHNFGEEWANELLINLNSEL